MDFSDRIKFLRGTRKFTAKQLGDALGVDATSISKWEQAGVIPNAKMLIAISNYFEVSVDFLLGLSEDFGLSDFDPWWFDVRVMENEKPFKSVTLSFVQMLPEAVGKDLQRNLFITQVLDDAMCPLILQTDKILVKKQETVDSGAITFLTLNNSEGLVRKVIYTESGIELHSENPYYPIRKIESKDSLKIYGIVKQLTRNF